MAPGTLPERTKQGRDVQADPCCEADVGDTVCVTEG